MQRYEGDASPFQHPARRPLLQRLVPVTEQVRGYRGGTLRRDLLAGVTVAALALPASLAYAEIAGLSPVIGLYALLLPAIAYALLRLLAPVDRRAGRVYRRSCRGSSDSVGRRSGAARVPGRHAGAARWRRVPGGSAGPVGLDRGLSSHDPYSSATSTVLRPF